MKDVTEILLEFREAARTLWNVHFRACLLEDHISRTMWHFRQIEARLFNVLVLQRIGIFKENCERIEDYSGRLLVVPNATNGVPILIQRSIDQPGYWDNDVRTIDGDVELRFISFFDWDELGFVDGYYFRVEIGRFKEKPRVEGLQGLVVVPDAKVFIALEDGTG